VYSKPLQAFVGDSLAAQTACVRAFAQACTTKLQFLKRPHALSLGSYDSSADCAVVAAILYALYQSDVVVEDALRVWHREPGVTDQMRDEVRCREGGKGE
jgi:hypothetical protein